MANATGISSAQYGTNAYQPQQYAPYSDPTQGAYAMPGGGIGSAPPASSTYSAPAAAPQQQGWVSRHPWWTLTLSTLAGGLLIFAMYKIFSSKDKAKTEGEDDNSGQAGGAGTAETPGKPDEQVQTKQQAPSSGLATQDDLTAEENHELDTLEKKATQWLATSNRTDLAATWGEAKLTEADVTKFQNAAKELEVAEYKLKTSHSYRTPAPAPADAAADRAHLQAMVTTKESDLGALTKDRIRLNEELSKVVTGSARAKELGYQLDLIKKKEAAVDELYKSSVSKVEAEQLNRQALQTEVSTKTADFNNAKSKYTVAISDAHSKFDELYRGFPHQERLRTLRRLPPRI